MRFVTALVGVAAVALLTAGVGAQGKPSFAGDWKKVTEQGQGEPGIDLTITQSATVMTIEYRAGTLAPAPGKLTYKLDGSASANPMAGHGGAPTERISRAAWAANTLVVTTRTGTGEERRTFSLEGDVLVVDTSAPARPGGAPTTTKATYKRYERGHGG